MRKWKPSHFLPKVVSTRTLLTHKEHTKLLSTPNFRHDVRNPRPPEPNLKLGPDPVWPVPQSAKNATSTPRILQLSTPKTTSKPHCDGDPSHTGSVSRNALNAKPSRRIREMSHPRVSYMVGLTVDMQHKLGLTFRERMRSRILETLNTSYADLTLGTMASDMRQFYRQQPREAPLEAFRMDSDTSQTTPNIGMSRVQSREERLQWEADRCQPKKDFTIYQHVPRRRKAPFKKLQPRLEVLSAVPKRYRMKSDDDSWDPFKVKGGAKTAVPSARTQRLAQPRRRFDKR